MSKSISVTHQRYAALHRVEGGERQADGSIRRYDTDPGEVWPLDASHPETVRLLALEALAPEDSDAVRFVRAKQRGEISSFVMNADGRIIA